MNETAFGRPDEALLIDLLRARHALLLSLVATAGERIVGHIVFSPVEVSCGRKALEGAALGPMAVLPQFQRAGVGSKLIEEGTCRLRDGGCPFIVVLGHPEYYPRFGFVPASRYGVGCQWDVPADVFMLLPLDPSRCQRLSGVARYREAFATLA